MGKIFCFMGKSSSGKDTIYKAISEEFKDIIEIVPYTTRPIREGEIDGVTYNFVTNEAYHQMLAKNQIIESRSYNTQHGIWTYFTAAIDIDLETNNYMNINTLVGYQELIKYYGKDKIIPIYIQVEDGERLQRAINRENNQQVPKYMELCRRFLEDQKDFNEENLKVAGINKKYTNNVLAECINQISNDINSYLIKEKQYHI